MGQNAARLGRSASRERRAAEADWRGDRQLSLRTRVRRPASPFSTSHLVLVTENSTEASFAASTGLAPHAQQNFDTASVV